MLKKIFFMIKEKISGLNPGQKKVFLGMVFFLFINTVILAAGIILIALLLKKL